MGSNVMGDPVNYQATRLERAVFALKHKNDESRGVKARKYLENTLTKHMNLLRLDCRAGTLCMIYNATGGPVTLVDYHEWSGRVGMSPVPSRIENGQWGAFFHCKFGSDSSSCVLVYDGKNEDEIPRQWLFAWKQRNDEANLCYAEIHEEVQYEARGAMAWDSFEANIVNGGGPVHQILAGDVHAYASIGNTSRPVFEAIMTLQNAYNVI